MKSLFLSGGQTKFIAIIAAAAHLRHQYGYNPDYIFGTSSGAISAALLGMNLEKEGIQIGRKLKMSDIFDKRAFNNNGKVTFSAITRILRGKNYLGTMGNLEKMLRKIITEHKFESYRFSLKTPEIGVLAVNASTKERKMFYLKKLDYDTMIKAIMASCSMPIVCPAVEIGGQNYYDGGVRDHSPGPFVLEKTLYVHSIKEAVTVYSRPENYQVPDSQDWSKNIFKTFMEFMLPTMTIEISKNDASREKEITQKKAIKYTPVYIDSFNEHMFDVNNSNLEKGLLEGIKAVDKYYK